MNCFPRMMSGMIELENVWLLGTTLVSGNILPFPGSQISIGNPQSPFDTVFANSLSNGFGELLVNDVSTVAPLTRQIEQGVANLSLLFDNTMTLNASGELGVRERFLTPSNTEFEFSDPLHFTANDELVEGGTVTLKYNDDDFKIEEGKLHAVLPTVKGFGALKVAGITDIDIIDQWLDDAEDQNIPKLQAIRLQTSDDFTQLSGKLYVRPKGLGQIPYYTLDGFGADEGLYYNSVSNTLSTNRILLTTNFVLSPNDVPTQAYVAQFIQAFPGGGIDVLPEIQGTGRREIKVRVDPSGCVMNDPSMAGALDVRIDNVTLLKKGGILCANYMGDEDGDLVVQGNMIRSIMSFTAPLIKTGNVVSLNLVAESPDLTYANGVLTCNITSGIGLQKIGNVISLNLLAEAPDLTLVGNVLTCNIEAGAGLVKTLNVISLAPTELNKLNEIPDDIGDKLDTLDDLTDKLGDLSSVVDGIGDLSKQIGIAVGTSALTSLTTTALTAAALGVAAKSQAQSLIAGKVAAATGIGAAIVASSEL